MATACEEYQEKVMEEMRKVYSETVIDHAMNPRGVRDMEAANGYTSITGPCGDTMQMWLKARNEIITKATFMTDGYGTSIASGSMAADIAKGKSICQALGIGQQDVLDALGGLP
jgi:nitrogen fixation NifU-like protein